MKQESKDSGVLGCSGISWTTCKQSAPRSRQQESKDSGVLGCSGITKWPHQELITQFLQAGCSSQRPTNSIKPLQAISQGLNYNNKIRTDVYI